MDRKEFKTTQYEVFQGCNLIPRVFLAFVILLICAGKPAAAQNVSEGLEDQKPEKVITGDAYPEIAVIFKAKKDLKGYELNPDDFISLFFTDWERALVREAVEEHKRNPLPEIDARPKTTTSTGEISEGESEDGMEDTGIFDATTGPELNIGEIEEALPPPDPGIRELSLGGILYSNDSKWIIWLNGFRVTPKSLPEEVEKIKVSRSHIDMVWYDEYTNQVFPIRLRPHERFNLDEKLFLTGAGLDDIY